jgi:hypothetical protein
MHAWWQLQRAGSVAPAVGQQGLRDAVWDRTPCRQQDTSVFTESGVDPPCYLLMLFVSSEASHVKALL